MAAFLFKKEILVGLYLFFPMIITIIEKNFVPLPTH